MTLSESESTNADSHIEAPAALKSFKKSVSDSKLLRRIKSITKLRTNAPQTAQAPVDSADSKDQLTQKEQSNPSSTGINTPVLQGSDSSQVNKSWRGQSLPSGSFQSAASTKINLPSP
jgi:hypothetical protein